MQIQVSWYDGGGEMNLADRTSHYALQSHVAAGRCREGSQSQAEQAGSSPSFLPGRQHKPPLISNLHLTFAHFRFLCTSGRQEWTSAACTAEPEHLTAAGRTGPTASLPLSSPVSVASPSLFPGMVGGSSFGKTVLPIWRAANSCMETCQPKRQIDRRLDEERGGTS